MKCFISLFLVVSTSTVNCRERLVSEMTCYVSSDEWNIKLYSLTRVEPANFCVFREWLSCAHRFWLSYLKEECR